MIYLFFSFSLRISSFPSTSSKGYTLFTDLLMTLLVLPIIILTPLVLSSCPFISSTTRPRIHLFQGCFSSSAITILLIDGFISFVFVVFFVFLSYSRNGATYSFRHRDEKWFNNMLIWWTRLGKTKFISTLSRIKLLQVYNLHPNSK